MGVKTPSYMVITWGCQMNEDDSRQMGSLLEQMGYARASDELDADVILLNTCSVRAKPEQKMSTRLGELSIIKRDKPHLIIGVCGCTAERQGAALLRRWKSVNLIMGTANIYELPSLLARVKSGERVLAVGLPERGGQAPQVSVERAGVQVGLKEFVPAMYGCNNFCAYCVVPYTRGPERSRPVDEIVREAAVLAAHGCREITLVGQNVNSYGKTLPGSCDFAGLLERLNDVDGLLRIRFMTSHPKDLSERLIDAIAALPKVCEQFHLPIQSGDDEILAGMGRGYTVLKYRSLVDRLRERVPGISLTTDVMVGFPGETEEQFKNTLQTIEAVGFDAAYMFEFNPRPGTRAASMERQLDHKTRIRRLGELIRLQNGITIQKNRQNIGREMEVLAEAPGRRGGGMGGFTRGGKMVLFTASPETAGRLVKVKVTDGGLTGLSGHMVTP